MSNLLKRVTIIFLLAFVVNIAFCCDNSTIAITNQTSNLNGSITYDLDLYVELGTLDAVFYGYLLSFNSSTSSPVVDLSGVFPTTTIISNGNGTIVSGSISGTLQGVTGANINSIVNDSDWGPFVGMSNVLSFESNQLFGATSNDLTMQVQVTVMGCVEEIEFYASVNSGAAACVKTASTGQNCCAAPSLVITDPSAVCSPSTVDITTNGVTLGSDPGTLTYWSDASATSSLLTPSSVGSGTYYIQLESGGCVSIEAVNVTVNALPSLVITDPSAVCSPLTVDLTTSGVTAGSDIGTLTYWTDAAATNSLVNPNSVVSGLYYIQLENNGCTSIQPVNASVLSNSSGNYNATICPGGFVVYNGTTYDSNNLSGTEVFTAVNGCDSIVAVSITVQQSVSSSFTASICENDSLVYNGTTYNAANLTGSDTLVSLGGCDSIVNVSISLLLNSTASVTATICFGESFVYNGVVYDASNLTGVDTLQAVSGCDSIVTITVIELPDLSAVLDTVICNGDSFEFNGTVYGGGNLSGTELFNSIDGCDSVVTVSVSEYPIYSSVLDTVVSGSISFEFNGTTYSESNPSGTELYVSSTGCDSIVYINVVFENESIYFIPDGFSPNGDGANDYVYVMGKGLQEVNFKVFNRWGELVFESDCCCQQSCGWDGTINGQKVNNGTFVYLFEAIDVNGSELISKGTISLIK